MTGPRLRAPSVSQRRGDDKAPGAVFRDTLDVALVGQLFQVLVDSSHIDTHLIRKACCPQYDCCCS